MPLLKLEPEQITRLWPSIAPGIQETIAPTAGDGMKMLNAVLAKLLSGEMRLWIITKTTEADLRKNTLYAHLTTIPAHDWCTGNQNLMICSYYGWEKVPPKLFAEAWGKMREYARAMGCESVIAFTRNERVKEMAGELGWDTSVTFLEGAA